ncbi:MAG: hypothetical protein WD066_04250 [Planctomycetaceae bacterium]
MTSLPDPRGTHGARPLLTPEYGAVLPLHTLTSPVALLDGRGVIRARNPAWDGSPRRRFFLGESAEIGTNYLELFGTTVGDIAADFLTRMSAGVSRVIGGHADDYAQFYLARTPEGERWFHFQAVALTSDAPARVLVGHEVVTISTSNEDVAAPAGVSLPEPDGATTSIPAAGERHDTLDRLTRETLRVLRSTCLEAIESITDTLELVAQQSARLPKTARERAGRNDARLKRDMPKILHLLSVLDAFLPKGDQRSGDREE